LRGRRLQTGELLAQRAEAGEYLLDVAEVGGEQADRRFVLHTNSAPRADGRFASGWADEFVAASLPIRDGVAGETTLDSALHAHRVLR
jgi:hypothetical protein